MSTDSPDWGHALVARNHDRDSLNPIHDDPVAEAYGFRGGLVPGVDVFAYLVHPVVRNWGPDWLRTGRLVARFISPVYDETPITITGFPNESGSVELMVTDAEGTTCATARADRSHAEAVPDPADWPDGDEAGRGHPASAESLAKGTALVPIETGFRAERAGEYLGNIGETAPVFADEAIAHPGWLLRFANHVLADQVQLGPWIHVTSDVRFFGCAADGERVRTSALVTAEYERKGHRFVELDVLITANGRPVQRVHHVAIHTLRPAGTRAEA